MKSLDKEIDFIYTKSLMAVHNRTINIWLIFKSLRIVAIISALVAIGYNSYIYYIVLRYIICTTAFFGIWLIYRQRKYILLGPFILTALLFNPFIPIHLKRQVWIYIDIAVVFVFIGSFILLKIKRDKEPPETIKTKRGKDDAIHKERPDREPELWENPLSINKLENIRNYLLSELTKMEATDWADYALRAICTHSPDLSKLMVNGQIDISFIKESERNGIADAINSIKKVVLKEGMTLRELFREIFKTIYVGTTYSKGNKFYWFGRDRVIQMLRSFTASTGRFNPTDVKFYDVDGDEFKLDKNIDNETIIKLQKSLEYFEQQTAHHRKIERLKDYYRFKIDSEYPVIEFDLNAVEKANIFKYEGSLVNSLFIELKKLLYVVTDYAFLKSRAFSHPLYDCEIASFASETGVILLVKYAGLVEYFPDRLYIELQNIDQDSWVVNWIKSYKLHLEGND